MATDVDRVFDLLDAWRHLPAYQLERRADVFFALYLPAFLSNRLDCSIDRHLIPEFPARIGSIYPSLASNQSVRIDYVALAEDRSRAWLIELKTDAGSRRGKQDQYLRAAQQIGLHRLVAGVLQIVPATSAKRKYYCLLRSFEDLGLIEVPERLHEAMGMARVDEFAECLNGVRITAPDLTPEILYVQPRAAQPDEIGFDEFADWLDALDDDMSARFARSLRNWATHKAGEPSRDAQGS
jgi:hypothetical protein